MDVIDLLEQEGIAFTPKGVDFIVQCLNPDHEDNNPSMRVDSVSGIFQCFSCGFKGNIFTHYEETPDFLQIQRNGLKRTINKVRAESIGLTIPTGATPYEGTWREISEETYKKFNAFLYHDPEFNGRLWFPITDVTGRIAVFQGRLMSVGTPKYKFFPQKVKVPMFTADGPFRGSMIIVEGIYDLLNLYDKGLTNVTAIFGVNNLNKQRLGLLYMRGVTKLDVFMDGDKAGKEGAAKVEKLCEEVGIVTRNICIEDQDPGSLSQEQVNTLKRKLYG